MNVDSYKLLDYPFDSDEWEFIHSLMFLKPKEKLNILEIGSGNISLLYALATNFESKMNKLYSIDFNNVSEKTSKLFQHKRTAISVIQNRGCYNTIAIEDDFCKKEVMDDVEIWLGKDKINFLIFEFIKNEELSNLFFQKFNHLFHENMTIYYNGINKNDFSEIFFNNLAKNRKSVKLTNNHGIGIILD